MLIYVNITDRRTDKHIKSIVRNLTKKLQKKLKKKKFFIGTDGQTDRQTVYILYFSRSIYNTNMMIDVLISNLNLLFYLHQYKVLIP